MINKRIDHFNKIPHDIIEELLQIIIEDSISTFGVNSKFNIIENILCLVSKEWNVIIKNNLKYILSYKTDNYFKYYNSLKSVEDQCCNYIYHDCNGFKSLKINWKKNYNSHNSSKKFNLSSSDVMIIDNFTFNEDKQVYNMNYEIIRWLGCLRKLNHVNISKLYTFGIRENQLQIVFEPVDISLNMLIFGNYKDTRDNINKLDPTLIQSIMYQLLSALKYCHSYNICHGNISPHRILFKKVPEGLLLKLADFKNSPSLVTQNDRKNQPTMPSYRSPELVNKNIYSEKNDIWAAGNMMILMSSEYYTGTHYQLGYDNFIKLLETNKYCPTTKKLIFGLINFDHKNRYTADQALKQSYFDKITNICPVIKKYLSQSQLITKRQNDEWYMSNHWVPTSNPLEVTYLFGKNQQANTKCWEILVNWLLQVTKKLKLNNCVISAACQYLYVYLKYHDVSRKRLQLVGCAALYLACTWIENLIPPLSDFVYISSKAFSLEDIDNMVQDFLLKLQGHFWIYTFIDYQHDYIHQKYNTNLTKWIELLESLTQINHNLVLMPKKLIYSNLVFIMDLINEILTGKSNTQLRERIFNLDGFKESHFKFINLFRETYLNIVPYDNNIYKDNNKLFEEYKLLQPIKKVLKELSKTSNSNLLTITKKATTISQLLCITDDVFITTNQAYFSNDKSKTFQDYNMYSIYILTSAILTYRLNNINHFPLKNTFSYKSYIS